MTILFWIQDSLQAHGIVPRTLAWPNLYINMYNIQDRTWNSHSHRGSLRSVTSNKGWKLYHVDYYKLYLFLSSPLSLICSDSFLQKARVSYTTPTPSLVMVRVSCRGLDSEDVYVQVRCDLIADADTVADQIKEREDLERKETIRVTRPA